MRRASCDALFLFVLSAILNYSMIPQISVDQVPLSSIDIRDTTYRLRPADDSLSDQRLKENIRLTGILHPPLFQVVHGNQYIILSGRKRILAAQSLGVRKVSGLVLQQSADPLLKWRTILLHSLIGSSLSCIERATFFSKAAGELSISEQCLLLPLLERKPQQYVLEELARYLTLAPETMSALHAGYLQEKLAKKLAKLSFEDQQTIVDLIRYYKFGGTKQKKLVGAALDLIMRTGHSFTQILAGWNQNPAEEENRPQQAMALLSWLEAKCFPQSTLAREQFKKFQRGLQLPESCTITPSHSFEDNSVTLSMVFDNQDQFLQRWSSLKKIISTGHE
ncbi:MAG TPA: hypothetical protein ENK84_03215 [Desulfobulbus sp.]|nr:hypothetical protein [Desulfobulbus sp.]